MKDLNDVVEKVKQVDDGVNNLIIPILKDTIADSNRHNKRLFILNMVLAVSLLLVAMFSQILVAYQNTRYADFLGQFEFESEVSQNVDNNSVVNDGITITK